MQTARNALPAFVRPEKLRLEIFSNDRRAVMNIQGEGYHLNNAFQRFTRPCIFFRKRRIKLLRGMIFLKIC